MGLNAKVEGFSVLGAALAATALLARGTASGGKGQSQERKCAVIAAFFEACRPGWLTGLVPGL